MPDDQALQLAAAGISDAEAMRAVRQLLSYIGDDAERGGLLATPARVLKAWRETWGAGYSAPEPELTCFAEDGIDYSQMVIVKDIAFYSTCEHHMAPFFGSCDIGYIPQLGQGVLGISKLARVTDFYARRLQVQERLTAQIASHLVEHVSPHVAVVMKATHMCMVSRGVMQPNAMTVTSALKGDFYADPTTRAEFLRLSQAKG